MILLKPIFDVHIRELNERKVSVLATTEEAKVFFSAGPISNPMTSVSIAITKGLSDSLTKLSQPDSKPSSILVFDVETNALKIGDVTTIHCCAIHDGNQTQLYEDPKVWIPILENADVLVGHHPVRRACHPAGLPQVQTKGAPA
jgi:hypothetical protein